MPPHMSPFIAERRVGDYMFQQSRRNLKKGSKMTVSKRKKRRKRMEKRKKATGRRLTVMKVKKMKRTRSRRRTKGGAAWA